MEIKEIVREIGSKFEYRSDVFRIFDWWFVMRERNGKLRGDCEDFSLTAIWMLCNRSVLQFLWKVIISHQYRIYFCKTVNGEGHAIGYANSLWFDNWTREALDKAEFLKQTKHKIWYFIPGPLILFNMLLGSLVRNRK